MTLTVIANGATSEWAAEISEETAMRALHAGLQAMFPGQVPDVDLEEAPDNIILRNNSILAAHARGPNTCRVEIIDQEPAA